MKPITMVRVYLTEAEGQRLKKLLKYLHDDSQVCGVTVLRGISGFGQSGKIHAAHLVDLSLDLPIISTEPQINRYFTAKRRFAIASLQFAVS